MNPFLCSTVNFQEFSCYFPCLMLPRLRCPQSKVLLPLKMSNWCSLLMATMCRVMSFHVCFIYPARNSSDSTVKTLITKWSVIHGTLKLPQGSIYYLWKMLLVSKNFLSFLCVLGWGLVTRWELSTPSNLVHTAIKSSYTLL